LEIFDVSNLKMKNSSGTDGDRRNFLTWLGVSLSGLIAAFVGVPVVSFILAPFTGSRREYWRSVGPVEQFTVGDTVEVSFANARSTPWADGFAETAAWLQRRSEQEFIAFSINCSHLGCPVRWVAASELFMCPCHGGVYYKDGSVAAGPPPRGLTKYPVRVKDGHVQIQTSPVPIT
jgi:menaquinol-cytochrome c reductase iron-sulfur subunit